MDSMQLLNLVLRSIIVLVLIGPTAGLGHQAKAADTRPSYDPTNRYQQRHILGWRVLVHSDLLADTELAKATLTELENQLYRVTRAVPAPALQWLKRVAIWVELANPEVVGGCYHPSAEWLGDHGFNPEKAKSIEIGNARNFVSWGLHQPYMLLHELAHAYHHQVLGYEQPQIKAAYRRAADSKSYADVLNHQGHRVRHYAMNNDQEYFAECTEAFFGTNDFYPFVRAELKLHDPGMAELLNALWSSPPSTTPHPVSQR